MGKRPDTIIRNKSKEQRDKVSKSWDNLITKEIRCKKISSALRGNKNKLGTHHSEETKMKIGKANSIALKGKFLGENHRNWKGGLPKCSVCGKTLTRYDGILCLEHEKERRAKGNGFFFGKKHSEKTKDIIRKKTIEQLKNNHLKQGTSIELIMENLLKSLDINYEFQYNFNNKFLCDFAIVDKKIIIECDGDYWHNREDNKKRDKAKNAYIEKCGWKIIRFWEHDIKNNLNNIKDSVLQVILEFRLP